MSLTFGIAHAINLLGCDICLLQGSTQKSKMAKIDKQLRRPETVEVGCPRHPGATTIGNQLQDGDRTDGWPNLTTQP